MEILHSLLYMLNEMSPYVLLGFLIAGLLHAFVPQDALARHLSGRGLKPVVKAALAGVPLPLCSCGVLPTAIAMRRGGASRAASTSFLIATPQTGVDSIAATWSLLGPAFAVVRPVAALVTSVFGGMAVGASEKKDDSGNVCSVPSDNGPRRSLWGKCKDALHYGFVDLVGSIGGWLVIGLIIAALITVYVPADFFAVFADYKIVAMLLVLVVSIPMYVCATGSIPIAMSLMLKGLSPGTALVMLMAGPAANFASFTLISREMGRKAAIIYVATIAAGAIAFGLAIDYLLPASWFVIGAESGAEACHTDFALLPSLCSALLVALLIYATIKHRFTHKKINKEMSQEYIITGMNCPHCRAAVTKAIENVAGVEKADVDLATGRATIEGNPDALAITEAVRAAGFDVK